MRRFGFLLLFLLSRIAGASLATGTVDYFPLAADGAGTNYSLTLNGSNTFSTIASNACIGQFTDANNASFPASFITAWNTATSGTSPWTLQFYAYFHDISNFPVYLSNQTQNNTYIQIHATLGIRLVCNGDTSAGFNYPLQTHLDTWINIAWTYDGTSLRLYIDNVLTKTQVQPGTWGTLTSLKLGRDVATGAAMAGYTRGLRFSNICLATGATGVFPTVDPANNPLSPYIDKGKSFSPNVMPPRLFGALLRGFTFTHTLYALEADTRKEQAFNLEVIKKEITQVAITKVASDVTKGIISRTITPSATPVLAASATATPTWTPSITLTHTISPTFTISATPTGTSSATPSPTITLTSTNSPTMTVTPTPVTKVSLTPAGK